MGGTPNSFDVFFSFPEDADLVHHARFSQFYYSQPAFDHVWIAHRAKIVAVSVGYDASLVAFVDFVSTLVDHVLIDDRVDENAVHWVVHVTEDIVVVPESVQNESSLRLEELTFTHQRRR